MDNEQARAVVAQVLDLWPAVKRYWSDQDGDKRAIYRRWLAALEKRELESMQAILDDWELVSVDKHFIAAPVQTLCTFADAHANRHRAKPRIAPLERSQVEDCNLAEIYELGRAAVAAGQDLDAILELVK